MSSYKEFHRRSILDREGFWAAEAKRIHWHKPFGKVLDYSRPPFAKWFVGGETNLCHNAVDRHVKERGDQKALVWISTEVDQVKSFSYKELFNEVNRTAAMMQSLGLKRGDRVIIYMPNMPEAVFAILACARLGAVHSVVFGGFAAASLAARIDDAKPVLMVTADGGSRAGKVIPYKPLVDESIKLSQHPPAKVLIYNRGLDPSMPLVAGRDVDWKNLYEKNKNETVDCVWLESSEPSYILYTSGTTGKPKGVQRDVGGHAVAMAASMEYIYCGAAGETIFTTSDIGWAVGHSYIIYAPLIAGLTSILYEGLPIRPDAGVWWKIVQDHKVNVMFSAPTAIRVLKKHDPALLKKYDLSSLKHLFLAGEPLDEPTHAWIAQGLGKPVIDHYWQTETGWPVLTAAHGVEKTAIKYGSPSFPAYGYDLKLLRESDASEAGADEKAVVAIEPPLPPGCLREDLFHDLLEKARLLDLRLGHPRQGRLLLHPRAHGRRHQRRRPSPGHARDRRSGEHASQHRGMRSGRRCGRAQGPDAPCVCRIEGSCEENNFTGSHGNRRQAARRDRAAEGGAFRDPASQDALRQDAAPLDRGARRRP